MHINTFHDTIHACRFCFMCRHLSPVGNVTFRESDTPRGRALMLDKVTQQPGLLEHPDFQGVLYDAELSAANRTHCVSHFDEAGLVLAARRDVVESSQVPAEIRKVADDLAGGSIVEEGDRGAEVVYYVDHYTATHQPEIAAAMEKLLLAAGLSFRTISGLDSGKALSVLGFHEEAKSVAATVAKSVQGGKILVTSCPAAYDAFKNDYVALGSPLDAEILHSSELILRLLESGKLKRPATAPKAVNLLASDYLKNYNNGLDAPARLLKALGIEVLAFGHNSEESYSAGEGAVIYDRINPRLAGKLVAHIVEFVENPEQDVLLAASPYTKFALNTFASRALHVKSLEEIAAAGVK